MKTHPFFLLFHIEIHLFYLVSGGFGAKEQAEFVFTNIGVAHIHVQHVYCMYTPG